MIMISIERKSLDGVFDNFIMGNSPTLSHYLGKLSYSEATHPIQQNTLIR